MLLVLVALVGVATAFRPISMAAPKMSSLQMTAKNIPGAVAPLGYFDPLGLANDKSPIQVKKIREAELKHGRLAMLAFVGILVGESFHPFFNGQISGPAIYQFQQADNLLPWFWEAVLFSVALIEGRNILVGWDSVSDTVRRPFGIAELREDYVNGDLGFDPLVRHSVL